MAIHKVQDVSIDAIGVSTLKKNDYGGKSVLINYSGEQLMVQTPKIMSYGISTYVDEKKPQTPPVFSTSFAFGDLSVASEQIKDFYKFAEELDSWAIDTALKHGKEWLGLKTVNRDIVEANYTPLIKVPKDQKTGEPSGKPHYLKVKLNKNANGDFITTFFNKEKEEVSSSEIQEYFTIGSQVRAILQVHSFWIVQNKFGLTLRVQQMLIEPASKIGKGYAFIEDEEDSTPANKTTTSNVASSSKSVELDDSSNDTETPIEKPVEKSSKSVVQDEPNEDAPESAPVSRSITRRVVNKK